jgi:hypothetical protein
MDDRQRVKQYIERTGSQSPERIRAGLYNGKGGPVRTTVIREVLAEVSGLDAPTPPSPSKPGKAAARAMAQFRAEHDYALKLRRAITALDDGYATEQEIKDAAGVPNHVWRRYAELPEFVENRLKMRDVTYWAPAKIIRQMKEIVGAA